MPLCRHAQPLIRPRERAHFITSTIVDRLLDLLAAGKAAHKTRSTRQFWQEGYHPQAIYSNRTMEQKIDYIHANPVRHGWVGSPEHGRYSSAHEWLPGSQPVSHVDSFDWKPKLVEDDGRMMDFDDLRSIAKTGKGATQRVMKPMWEFKQRGESGLWVSELFPILRNGTRPALIIGLGRVHEL